MRVLRAAAVPTVRVSALGPAVAARAPEPLRVVIPSQGPSGRRGGRGASGDPGPPGDPGEGVGDPGDLTLIFDNRLI